MTTPTAEASPLIDAGVARLRAPLVTRTSRRYVTPAILIHEEGD